MKKRRDVDAGKPLPHREILKLNRQAMAMRYEGDLKSMFPSPKDVETLIATCKTITPIGRKKASRPSLSTLVLKPGIHKPCQDLCPELEAWFKFVEPIPNNVCWLNKPKELYIKNTTNSVESRRLVYRENIQKSSEVVWDKLRPLSLEDLFSGKKYVSTDPPSTLKPYNEGLMYQYLVDNLNNQLRYNSLNNPYRFSAVSHSSRYSIKWPEKVKFNYKTFARAMELRVNTNMLDRQPWYTAPVLITQGLISNMFNRSRPKYQNKLPVGYTPKAMNCDDYNPVVRMQESIATNLPFRGVPQGYKWYVHTQREKSIRKRIANRATPGWSAHLEGKPYQQLEYGRYGLKRIPIGLDCDVGKDREKARYYAYWHNVTHWPLSKVEEYRNRYYFDEQDYNWWLYNTRALCPSDANQLDRWLEKRAVLNPPRLKYVRIEHEPICYTRLKSIGNFLLEPFKEKEATFKNILPMPIGEVRTEYQQTFEELRKATCRPTLSLVHSEISVEAQIGNLEDHLYEDHIPEILELTQQCADDFMLHLTRTEIKLKESGNEVDYLAFKQAMPLIAEQLKQKFPIPVLDDNEQVFVDRLAKQSGLYRYC